MKKPKAKGNKFESLIQKRLREIVPEACRTMGSGLSKYEKGDLRNFMETLIECKHYKKISWGNLMNWWKKIEEEADEQNLNPILIYRQNSQPILVMEKWRNSVHIITFENFLEYMSELNEEKKR